MSTTATAHALKGVDLDILKRTGGDLAHRPFGLRQVDLPTLPQPHERRDRQLPGDRAQYRDRWYQDINAKDVDVVQLRARVGMVFQKPNPFPKSIYDNIAYGPRIHGLAPTKADLDEMVAG